MKKLLPLFAALLIYSGTYAQITNGTYESWSSDLPDGWFSYAVVGSSVTQVAGNGGGSAAKLTPVDGGEGSVIIPVLTTFDGTDIFVPIASNTYSYFTFDYKLHVVAGETLSFTMALLDDDYNATGVCSGSIDAETGSFQTLVTDIFAVNSNLPTMINIQFEVDNSSGDPSTDSYAIIDNVRLDNSTTPTFVANPMDLMATSIFPNPCTDHFTARFATEGNFTVSLYNMNGALVMQQNVIGTSQKMIDTSSLVPGVYEVVLNDGKRSAVHRLVIE